MSRGGTVNSRRELSFSGLSAGALPTTLISVTGQQSRRGTFTVVAPSGTGQTLSVQVWRKPTDASPLGASDFDGYVNIQPGEARCMDLDLEGAAGWELVAVASGAGISGIFVFGALNS